MKRMAKESNCVVVKRDPRDLKSDLNAHERLRSGSDEETSYVAARWGSRSANMAAVRGWQADWRGGINGLSLGALESKYPQADL